LSYTIFEIPDIEEYHDLEIYTEGNKPGEFMHDLYIAKSTELGLSVCD